MPPGKRHELITELVEQSPTLLAGLIEEESGEPVPDFDKVWAGKESANIRYPQEFRSDAVRVFFQDSIPKLAVIVEMQHRPEKKKGIDWPHFLFATRAVYGGCPTFMVVITVSRKTAAWAREPIDGGGGMAVMRPIVVCLDEREPSDDLAAVLLGMFAENATTEGLRALAEALATIPEEPAKQYADILLAWLQGKAFETWRDLMKYSDIRYQNAYADELRAEGRAEGRAEEAAEAILRILAKRGIVVSERAQRKIRACKDQSQLDHWLDESVVTDDVERLFSE